MSYRVSTAGFEGPFDLLLALVARQKVDIGTVSVSDVTDQFLAEVQRLQDMDLDVASDFVVVASALLEIKAASLVPHEEARGSASSDIEGLDEESLTPDQLREALVDRLMIYRQFKSAALVLQARGTAQARMHSRTAGPDPDMVDVMPDYLKDVTLEQIAQACARLVGRKERLLLESEHIAARRIPLEDRVDQVRGTLKTRTTMTFEELVETDPSVQNRVVSLLALLELNKRRQLTLEQRELFGAITIRWIGETLAQMNGDVSDDAAREGDDE